MIPIFKPCYGREEIEALSEVIKSGWVGLGPKVERFEKEFADFLGGGTKCVAVSSCSSALQLAVRVLCSPGDEIITTPMTFVSTNHAILRNGCSPVFCDVKADDLNIDPSKIESLITEKTSCIVVVHYGGYSCDMDAIMEIARTRGLKVIEDVAHGAGGSHKQGALGTIGDAGCFSFHAVKNIAAGSGGMISFHDPKMSGELRKLRWLGIDRDTWTRTDASNGRYSWSYDIEYDSDNSTMTDLTAALGIVQLAKVRKTNARRSEITKLYNGAFKDTDWIETPTHNEYATKPACHNYVIKIQKRDRLHDFLNAKEISTGVHYVPNNHFRVYENFRGDTPVSDKVWKRLLSLPIFPDLTNAQVEYVVESVLEFGAGT